MKLGLISGIHEDIKQLKQAISILESHKCDKIICLGDLVGYSVPYYGFLESRNTPSVIELVRKKCDFVVKGNHDLFAIKKIPHYKARFKYPSSWYLMDYWKRKEMANGKIWLYENNELSALLNKKNRNFINKLPEFIVENFDGVRILLSHYAYPDLTGSTTFEIKNTEDIKKHFKFMKKFGCTLSFSGHDHIKGIIKFVPNCVEEVTGGKVKINKNISTWIIIPSVASGSFANGVTVFDTVTFEAKVFSLKSKKHMIPEWGNYSK